MARNRQVKLAFLGLGNVGSALLRQVIDTRQILTRRAGLELVPVALADISGALLDSAGIGDGLLRAALDVTGSGGLLESMPGAGPADSIAGAFGPGVVLADLTASSETVPFIELALDSGAGVALANKIPLAGPWAETSGLYTSSRLRYEVTVGAGLPVISTLQYLVETGDHVAAIEGCLSGTLGYLCAELEQGVPFSSAVEQAKELGYTEPDPRQDLGGKDVARKALILARTAGWPLEPQDIQIEALYPDDVANVPVGQYMATMHRQNASLAARFGSALERGETFRYVARVGPGGGSVGLVPVPQDGALGALQGPGNYIALHTERYPEIPLVVAGPGAGPEVTAAGVLGDIIRLCREA